MNTITTDNKADKYFAMLVDLTPDVKIELIKKLADSLKKDLKDDIKTEKEDNNIFDQLDGSWGGSDKTAEELVAEIRNSRYFEDRDIKL